MKILQFIILFVCTISFSSCFMIPIGFVTYGVYNNENLNYNEASGYEGKYISTTDNPKYILELELTSASFKGNILALQNADTLENCTFYRMSRRGGMPGLRAKLTCNRLDEDVSGGFSFDVNESTNIMTIYGVDGSLDLAIPNNLELVKMEVPKK